MIRVEFEEAQTGEVIGWSEIKYKKLPISFATETTVKINGQDYQVVAAEPETEKEYRKSGTINVKVILADETGTAQVSFEKEEVPHVPRSEFLEETESKEAEEEAIATGSVPISDVLMSLPTIHADLPERIVEEGEAKENLLSFHWDYWREVELVSKERVEEIRLEFARIASIWKNQRVEGVEPPAFRELYPRKGIEGPLNHHPLEFRTLITNYFAFHVPFDGLSFTGEDGVVQDAFAIRTTSGLNMYGIKKEGLVSVLGLARLNQDTDMKMLRQDSKYLAKLLEDHQLYLVDWTETLLMAGEDELYQYLRRTDHLGINR